MSSPFNWRPLALISALTLICLCVGVPRAEAPEPSRLVSESTHAKRQPAPPEVRREARLYPWANLLESCTVTYYDVCALCCGTTDGITFTGAPAIPYETCAVDPDVIPLGSTVLVDYGDGELHCYRAEDIGGSVKGNHIDVCVSEHEEALQLGIREATIYWLPEN